MPTEMLSAGHHKPRPASQGVLRKVHLTEALLAKLSSHFRPELLQDRDL
jgi:hypothetical protein